MNAITPNQLHILRHALGLDDSGRGLQYRNRYLTGTRSTSWADCVALRQAGLMSMHGNCHSDTSDVCFVVTQDGKDYVNAQHTTADDFVAWAVTLDDVTCIVFAATKAKAQWITVRSYQDVYGSRRGVWPRAVAKRAPAYDKSPLRFVKSQTWDPDYVRNY